MCAIEDGMGGGGGANYIMYKVPSFNWIYLHSPSCLHLTLFLAKLFGWLCRPWHRLLWAVQWTPTNHVTWCVIFWRTPTSGVFNRVAWLMVPGCIVWVGGLFLKRAPLEISIQTCRWCAATLFLALHTLWEVLKIFSCDFLLGDTLTLHAFLTTSKLTSQLHE